MADTKSQQGFTIVELVVAVAVFVSTLMILLDIYSTVLNLNTKSQAAVRASEQVRNFMEAVVKDIRNSRIHYNANDLAHDSMQWSGSVPCGTTYTAGDYKLGLYREREDGSIELLCYYLSTASVASASGDRLAIVKQINQASPFSATFLNKPTEDFVTIKFLKFYVYPLTNPYQNPPANPDIQPFVTILARFSVQLPGMKEALDVPYQTSVSSDIYDIP